jgi:phosphoglycolate phosphatase-like HAD superfamily hydrolase
VAEEAVAAGKKTASDLAPNRTLFVWDLHGTLEQGNENAVIQISNQALKERGHTARFKHGDALRLYGKHWYEYFADILPEAAHEEHMELQQLSFAISDQSTELIATYMRPSVHAAEVLAAIRMSDCEQILISNTVPSAIPLFLKALGMEQFFDERHAFSVNAHAKDASRDKTHVLDEFLKGKHFDKVVVIGDSASDIELSRHIGGIGYLYAHEGYPFRAQTGDYCIHDLQEVLEELPENGARR